MTVEREEKNDLQGNIFREKKGMEELDQSLFHKEKNAQRRHLCRGAGRANGPSSVAGPKWKVAGLRCFFSPEVLTVLR